MELETIIGLEVHAQMNTKTKMFCSCDNDAWGKGPNTVVCPVCMGHPGTLPVPNRAVIEKAIRASKALRCTVNKESHFDRKNYFYPDLPCGYQISQYKFPLSSHGVVSFTVVDPKTNAVVNSQCRIHRLHIENDAGKLTHRTRTTLCDYNRAGTPLMEIVTEPDLRSGKEASSFAEELRRILIGADASEADMFKGMMRFDASISLRPKGDTKLYPRIEIKNLNSFKALEKAIAYQERVLRELWSEGKQPTGEVTVGWIDDEERTQLLREKESAADYRYFPEPDIPPLSFTDEYIASVTSTMTKLPSEMKEEYRMMGLTEAEARMLIEQPTLRSYFDGVKNVTGDGKRASSIILSQLVGFLAKAGKNLEEGPSIDAIKELSVLIHTGKITTTVGKEVLEAMVETGSRAQAIIDERGLGATFSDDALEAMVDEAIKENPHAIESFKKGKTSALGAIVGAVMKATKGQADAAKVNTLVQKKVK